MKSTNASLSFFSTLSFRFLRRSISFRVAAIVLLLAGFASPLKPAQAAPAEPAPAHVYMIRGVLNIFSLGMDQMAATLEAQGINATVHNHMLWASIADDAAAEYKSGRVKTIILVGHSSGATVLPAMVARLSQQGVPVKLAIGLDPTTRVFAAGRVERYINYYAPGGMGTVVDKGRDFHGVLQNISTASDRDVGHFNIDKNQALQERVIRDIRGALSAPARATTPVAGAKTIPVARATVAEAPHH